MENKLLNLETPTKEIGGAVLTPEVINQIKSFQDFDNYCINCFRGYIAEAICSLLLALDNHSGLDEEATNRLITDLSYCRGYLKELEGPVKNEVNPITKP